MTKQDESGFHFILVNSSFWVISNTCLSSGQLAWKDPNQRPLVCVPCTMPGACWPHLPLFPRPPGRHKAKTTEGSCFASIPQKQSVQRSMASICTPQPGQIWPECPLRVLVCQSPSPGPGCCAEGLGTMASLCVPPWSQVRRPSLLLTSCFHTKQ